MKRLITQHRRGTAEEWKESSIIPKDGEVVIEKEGNQRKIKVGNGVDAFSDLPFMTDELSHQVDVLDERVSNIISVNNPPTGDNTELADIRVGYDGITHKSAGDAVRAVGDDVTSLRNSLEQFIGAEAVDGLLYENNMLQLTANGVPVGEAVEVVGGSGGGGTGSSITVKLTNLTDGGTNFTLSSKDKVKLKFKFVSEEDGNPTGEYTCTVVVNGVTQQTLYLQQKEDGEEIDVTNFLRNDENKVKITCTDIYNNTRSLIYNINVIDMVVRSSFNSYQVYSSTNSPNGLDIRYSVVGLVDKIAYFVLDGTVCHSAKLSASTSGKESSYIIPLSKLTHGVHTLKIYADAAVGETSIRSNILSYDILFYVSGETYPLLGSTYDVTELSEGELVSIPYMVFDPNDAMCSVNLRVSYKKDGKVETYSEDTVLVDSALHTWSTRIYPVSDEVYFTVEYAPADLPTPLAKTHTVKVTKAEVDVEASSDPTLFLTAMGKTNDSETPGVWEFTNNSGNKITTSFSGFNWKSNGWVEDTNGDTCLRLSGGAQAIINFAPFSKDNFNIQNSGLTVEFEFAIRDVNNRDTVVINCYDGKTGIQATADKAFIKSAEDTISCNYKDEERTRLSFTIDKDGKDIYGNDSARFLSVYMNGVLTGITSYVSNNFTNSLPITLGDEGCTLDIYTIRVYDKTLSHREIADNYIADLTDVKEKIELFEDNDIYTANGLLDYEKVKTKIPTITFTGSMPTYKGDKKVVKMDFVNPFDHSKDFQTVYGGPVNVLIDVQGTSSQWYARKNWKIKLSDKKYAAKGVNNAKYQHMDDEIPANVFCIKVDYAEGTGTHNTQNANFAETLYDTLVPAQEKDDRVRTTITGFPCVIFEKETDTSEPIFSSKGNFNFDKDAEEAFGFVEDEDGIISTECWEFCNNTSDACNFLGSIPRDWVDDFEPRYTPLSDEWDEIDELQEAKDDATDSETKEIDRTKFSLEDEEKLLALRDKVIGNADTFGTFANLHKWIVSTKNDLTKFKNEFTQYFDLEYASIYYVYTFFALMTDQRAKNMFLTRWSQKHADGTTTTKWYPYFYDNDTSYGINNEGYLVFDYYHEDTDQVDGTNVYNGQNSVLWSNFRVAFSNEIKQTYASLRSSGKLTYDKVVNQFIESGSSMWSASIYNEDAEFKYIEMARPQNSTDGTVDRENLYQVRGNGEPHLKYFVKNRIKYCDSKWNAGDYPDDRVTMRINTPQVLKFPTDVEITSKDLTEGQKFSFCVVGTPLTTCYVSITHNGNTESLEVSLGDAEYAVVDYVVTETASHTFSVPEGYSVVEVGGSYPDGATDEQKAEIDARNATVEASLNAVPANPAITVTPYSDMYCGVKYKANGTLRQKRVSKNTPFTFGSDVNETFNDTETAVFGASELSSLGDLSGLYCSTLSVSAASKLTTLIVGNKKADYRNIMLRDLNVGANTLLQYIDVTNCSRLDKPIDLSKCPNIEEIYALGTSITGILLPSAGYIHTMHLPNTINNLTITNHPTLKNLKLGESGMDTSSITKLCIANCGDFNSTAILESCLTNANVVLERVRLTDVNWTNCTVAQLQKLYKPKSEGGFALKGIGADGSDIEEINITGKCILNENVSGEVMAELKEHFKYLTFVMGSGYSVSSTVTFMNDLGTEALYVENIESSYTSDIVCPDPVKEGKISYPTREATNESVFEWDGWSISSSYDRTAQSDALLNICGDRVLYPTFKASKRYYPVDYYTGESLLYRTSVGYNEYSYFDASLVEDASLLTTEEGTGALVPIKTEVDNPSLYEFTGAWSPSADLPVTSHTKRYAQFYLDDSELYKIPLEDFDYSTNANSLTILNYKGVEKDIKIMDSYMVDGQEYSTVAIDGESDSDNTTNGFAESSVSIVDIPDGVSTIGKNAFYNTQELHTLIIGEGVTSIGSGAFALPNSSASKLTTIEYNAVSATVETSPNIFDGRYSTKGATLVVGENVKNIPSYAFAQSSLPSSSHFISKLDLSNAHSCEKLGGGAFVLNNIEEIVWGDGLKTIGVSCFDNNRCISRLTIPEGVTTIENSAFSNWIALTDVSLPSTIERLTGAFRECPNLANITVPGNSIYEIRNNALVNKATNHLALGTYLSEIDSTITSIGESAFEGCSRLKRIEIPNTVGDLSTRAFTNCLGLEEIILHNGLTRLGTQCLYGCQNLTAISLPDTVTFIGNGALGATGISEITLPKTVNTCQLNPFLGCTKLKTVTILNEGDFMVQNLNGKYPLFEGCSNLETIRVNWNEGDVVGAPWGAPDGVTILYRGEWE